MNLKYTINDCIMLDIPTFTDERGSISVIDKELPFKVKRVFWLHHIQEGMGRGAHALLEGSEIMCSLHGSFKVNLFDGKEKTCITLDTPSKGLLIRPGIWFTTHSYKNEGVTMVLASEEYSRDKYTYNYEDYILLRKVQ